MLRQNLTAVHVQWTIEIDNLALLHSKVLILMNVYSGHCLHVFCDHSVCTVFSANLICGLRTLRESPSNHYACTSNAPWPNSARLSGMAAGYDTQDFLGTDTTPEQYACEVGVKPELLDREFPSTNMMPTFDLEDLFQTGLS